MRFSVATDGNFTRVSSVRYGWEADIRILAEIGFVRDDLLCSQDRIEEATEVRVKAMNKGRVALMGAIIALIGAIALEAVPIYGTLPVAIQAIPLIIIGLSAQNIISARGASSPALRKIINGISVLLALFILSFAVAIFMIVESHGNGHTLIAKSSAICAVLGAVCLILNSVYILRIKAQNS